MAQNVNLDKELWKKEREKYVYQDKKPTKVENNEVKPKEVSKAIDWAMIARIVLYCMIIALIIFLIYRFVPRDFTAKKKQKPLRKTESIEDAENNLSQVDLSGLLEKLEKENDLRGALRVQLLILLQWAQKKHIISWKKWKTNGRYVREWPQEYKPEEFKEFTRLTDYYWWGMHQPEMPVYLDLSQRANQLKNQLKPANHE